MHCKIENREIIKCNQTEENYNIGNKAIGNFDQLHTHCILCILYLFKSWIDFYIRLIS